MPPRRNERERGRTLSIGWDDAPGTLGGAPGGDGPSGPRRDPADERSAGSPRRRRLLLLGTACALVLVLALTLPRLARDQSGPEDVVVDLLQAVVAHDLATVREHVEDSESSSGAALTAEVLDGATGGIRDFDIRGVERTAGTATVTVDLFGDRRRGTGTFTLQGISDGPFSPVRWQLEPVRLPELRLTPPLGVHQVEVSGIRYEAEELRPPSMPDSAEVAMRLLPGTYMIALPVESPWLEPARMRLSVPLTLGASTDMVADVDIGLSEEGRQELEYLITTRLEECGTGSSPALDGCTIADPVAGGGGGLARENGTWTLTGATPISIVSTRDYMWAVSATGTARFTPDGAESPDPGGVQLQALAQAYLDPHGDLRLGPSAAFGTMYAHCHDAETGRFTGVALVEDPEDTAAGEACGDPSVIEPE